MVSRTRQKNVDLTDQFLEQLYMEGRFTRTKTLVMQYLGLVLNIVALCFALVAIELRLGVYVYSVFGRLGLFVLSLPIIISLAANILGWSILGKGTSFDTLSYTYIDKRNSYKLVDRISYETYRLRQIETRITNLTQIQVTVLSVAVVMLFYFSN